MVEIIDFAVNQEWIAHRACLYIQFGILSPDFRAQRRQLRGSGTPVHIITREKHRFIYTSVPTNAFLLIFEQAYGMLGWITHQNGKTIDLVGNFCATICISINKYSFIRQWSHAVSINLSFAYVLQWLEMWLFVNFYPPNLRNDRFGG